MKLVIKEKIFIDEFISVNLIHIKAAITVFKLSLSKMHIVISLNAFTERGIILNVKSIPYCVAFVFFKYLTICLRVIIIIFCCLISVSFLDFLKYSDCIGKIDISITLFIFLRDKHNSSKFKLFVPPNIVLYILLTVSSLRMNSVFGNCSLNICIHSV